MRFRYTNANEGNYETEMIREPPNAEFPHLWDLAATVPVMLLNGDNFMDFPRPLSAGIHYLGYHCAAILTAECGILMYYMFI